MFEKRKLEPCRQVLHECFITEPHAPGCTVVSGLVKEGSKYTKCFVRYKTLGETLATGLGDEGIVDLTYRLDQTLEMKLTFSWGENDEEYELIRNMFYEYEECDFDDLPDDMVPFHDLELVNITDENKTEIKYTVNGVSPDTLAKRAERLTNHVFNIYDVYLENLLEEYGELDED